MGSSDKKNYSGARIEKQVTEESRVILDRPLSNSSSNDCYFIFQAKWQGQYCTSTETDLWLPDWIMWNLRGCLLKGTLCCICWKDWYYVVGVDVFVITVW